MQKALKDLPLQEITLRKYEEPMQNDLRELTRKFLLSIGLLNPGDSRDIIIDIFYELLLARNKRKFLQIEDFENLLLKRQGASKPNIRRQLRRLKELKLLEKAAEGYRIVEFASLKSLIERHINEFIIKPTMERLLQYADKLDSLQLGEKNQNE
ncbi:MAG: hypothetical protein QW625_01085 [Candidatus Nanoarchaeia archaeon]